MYKKMFLIVAIVLIQFSCQSQEKKETNQINFFQAFYEQNPRQNNPVRIDFWFLNMDSLHIHYLPYFEYDALDKMKAYIYVIPKSDYMATWKMNTNNIKNEYNIMDSIELKLIEEQDRMLRNFIYIAFVYTGNYFIKTGNCIPDEYEAKGCRDEYEICDTCYLSYEIYLLEGKNKWTNIGNFKNTKVINKYQYMPEIIVKELIRKPISEIKSLDDILLRIK